MQKRAKLLILIFTLLVAVGCLTVLGLRKVSRPISNMELFSAQARGSLFCLDSKEFEATLASGKVATIARRDVTESDTKKHKLFNDLFVSHTDIVELVYLRIGGDICLIVRSTNGIIVVLPNSEIIR